MKSKIQETAMITSENDPDDDGYISKNPTRINNHKTNKAMSIDSDHDSSINMDISIGSQDDIQMKVIEYLNSTINNNYTFTDDSGFEKSNICASTPKSHPIETESILIDNDEEIVPMEWSDNERNKINDISFTDLCSTSSDNNSVEITNTLRTNTDHIPNTLKKKRETFEINPISPSID